MTQQTFTRAEAEANINTCECGKTLSRCGTTEICLTCVRKLNPKEFRETLVDLLTTWTDNRPDIELEELNSLCPAIGSMIHLQARNAAASKAEADG
jgi:hypothetical protein